MNFNNLLKATLFLFLFLVATDVQSQAIEKGAGITYTKGVPTHIPRIKYDAEINIDINNGNVYEWNRTLSQWRQLAEGIDIGNINGLPTYIPGYGQSPFVINNQKKIYWYAGGWSCLNCSLGDVIAKNGLTEIVDSMILGGSLDRNTTITGSGLYSFSLDSLSAFYNLVWTSGSSAYNIFSSLPTASSGVNITSTSTSIPTINANLNLRPGNPSQLISRTDSLNSYYRLTPDSIIVGNGSVNGYATTNKQFIISRDSFILKNVEYTPTRSINRVVIRPDGVVFKDSTTIDEDPNNEFQSLSIIGDTLYISNGNSIVLPPSSNLYAGSGISISGDTIYNTGDLDPINELQYIDSFYVSNDSLFISLSLDSTNAVSVDFSNIWDGNGIYGGDGIIPNLTNATLVPNGQFSIDYTSLEAIIVNDFQGAVYLLDKTGFFGVNVTSSSAALLGPAGSVAVGDTSIKITNLSINSSLDSILVVNHNGELFLLHKDSINGVDGNGIYGGGGIVPPQTVAVVDSILYFVSDNDLGHYQIHTHSSFGLFGTESNFKPDSIRLDYFDVSGTSNFTLNQNGITLSTDTPDRVVINGNDTRYQSDYRSTYNDRSLIDKKYGDDFYLQSIDTFRISNDTLFVSLSTDSLPESFVVLPIVSDGNGIYGGSGYISDGTYAQFGDALNDDSGFFGIGYFPIGNVNSGEVRGFGIDDGLVALANSDTINNTTALVSLGNSSITLEATSLMPSENKSILITPDALTIDGLPEGPQDKILTISPSNEVYMTHDSLMDNQRFDTLDQTGDFIRISLQNDNEPYYEISLEDYVNQPVILTYNTATGIIDVNNAGTGDTIPVMLGAGPVLNGEIGLVPKPMGGDDVRYLLGNGTWVDINLDDLNDVVASIPTSGSVLFYNGLFWTANPALSTIVGTATQFFLDSTSAVADNYALTVVPPSFPQSEVIVSVDSASSPVFMERFVSDSLGKTHIDAGLWNFNIYGAVSIEDQGFSQIQWSIHKRIAVSGLPPVTGTFTGAGPTRTFTVTGATPFVAGDANVDLLVATQIETPNQTAWITGYTSSSVVTVTLSDPSYVNESGVLLTGIYYPLFNTATPNIYYTSPGLSDVSSVQPRFDSLNFSDKLVITFFAFTNDTTDRDLSLYYGGTEFYTNFNSPLSLGHNDLYGLNTGDYLHLTQEEYNNLDLSILNELQYVDTFAINNDILSISLTKDSIPASSVDLSIYHIQDIYFSNDTLYIEDGGGLFETVIESADGNGIYSGSGYVPDSTYAQLGVENENYEEVFALGYFPTFPEYDDFTAKGLLFRNDFIFLTNGDSITERFSTIQIGSDELSLGATGSVTEKLLTFTPDNVFFTGLQEWSGDSILTYGTNGNIYYATTSSILANSPNIYSTSGTIPEDTTRYVYLDTFASLKVRYLSTGNDLLNLSESESTISDITGTVYLYIDSTSILLVDDSNVDSKQLGFEGPDQAGLTINMFGGATEGQTIRAGGNGTFYYSSLDSNSTNEIQRIDSLYISNDSLFISLLNDEVAASKLNIYSLSLNGIYSGDGIIPSGTNAKLASTGTFRFDYSNDENAITISDVGTTSLTLETKGNENSLILNSGYTTLGGLGSTVVTSAAAVDAISPYFGISNDASAGELRIYEPGAVNYTAFTTTAQSVNLTYTLPFTAPNEGEFLKWTAGGQLIWDSVLTIPQFVDTFEISSDTLRISLSNDGVPFEIVDLSPYLDNTDTSGYNLDMSISGDTLYLTDGAGQLFVKLPAGSGDTLDLQVAFIEGQTGLNFELDLLDGVVKDVDGANVSFNIPADSSNLQVFKNGSLLSQTGDLTTRDYTVNATTNTITFVDSVLSTDRIVILYSSGAIIGEASSTDLSFFGSSSTVILESSSGNDVVFEEGSNITFSQSGDTLTISAINGGDGNGIYSGSDTIPPGTIATVDEYFGFETTLAGGTVFEFDGIDGRTSISDSYSQSVLNLTPDSIELIGYKANLVVDTLDASAVTEFIGFPFVREPSVVSPSLITSDQDNYNPANWLTSTIVRIAGDSMIRAITGFASVGIADGHEKRLVNVGNYPIYIPGEHPDSQDSNRVSVGWDYIIYPKSTAWLLYDNISNRWLISNESVTTNYGKKQTFEFYGGSSTLADWGDIAFAAVNSGTVLTGSASNNVYPGYFGLRTSAIANSGYYIGAPKGINTTATFGDVHASIEAYVSLSALSVTADTFFAQVRLCAANTSIGNTNVPNSISIVYSHFRNGGNWSLVSFDNGGTPSTYIDLGVPAQVDVPVLLRLEIDKNISEARAYIDGQYVGRVTTNMPSSAGALGGQAMIQKMATGAGVDVFRIHNLKINSIFD